MRPSPRFCLLLLLAACRRENSEKTAPVVVDARPKTEVAAPVPASPPDLRAVPLYDPADPMTVPSLELSGEVQLAPESSPPKTVYVYVSSGDCLDANAPLLRRMPVTETGTFLAHLVAQPGTALSLCAAGELTPGGPSTLYGKYGKPIQVGPQREQELREIKINLAISSPRQFPTPKK